MIRQLKASSIHRLSARKNRPARLRRAAGHGVEVLESRVLLTATPVLGFHNDAASTGQNLTETVLTPASVNVTSFGKAFTTPVDGQIYAEPLYVPALSITAGTHQGTHNVVFVATEGDSLYAIDADTGTVLWQDSFLVPNPALGSGVTVTTVPSGDVNTGDITPQIGITSTPAIDSATGFLFLTAKTKQVVGGISHYVYALEKVNIHDGTFTSAIIGDTTFSGGVYTYNSGPYVLGNGDGVISVGGQNRVYFNALREMNRAGVTLSNGVVYLGFASHGDNNPYHGWILGYTENTLANTAAFNTSPNAESVADRAGIWQGGGRIAIDPQGFMYVETGNGAFDTTLYTAATAPNPSLIGFPADGDFGTSFIKIALDPNTSLGNQGSGATLNPNGYGLKAVDYFTPLNESSLSSADTDLGSGGPMILPDSLGSATHPHLLVGAGKEGKIYLIDRDNMGHFSTVTDNVVQEVSGSGGLGGGGSYDTPALFNDGTTARIYYVSVSSTAKSYTISNGMLSTTPDHASTDTYASRVGSASISANGTANGIMWAVNAANPTGIPSLNAYNASNISNLSGNVGELWTSNQNSARDALATASGGVKFSTPMISNGMVYVGTAGALVVYAPIAPPTQPPAAPTNLTAAAVSSVQVNLTWQENDTTAAGFDIEEFNPATGTFSQINTASAGATSFAVTGLTAGTNYTFRVRAFNAAGNSGYTNAASATTFSAPPSVDFSGGFANSAGQLTLTGNAAGHPAISGTRLRLTDGLGSEASSAFSVLPIPVDRFTTMFQFQLTSASADGFTFCIQNAAPNALGANGGSLGYGPGTGVLGIGSSVALKFDLYNGAPSASTTGLYTDGAAPNDSAPASIDMSTAGINLHSGDIMQVTLFYDGTTLQESVTDTVTHATFNHSYAIDIPGTVGGSTAFVGFTAGTGGLTATQDILNWTYTPLPAPPATPANLTVTPATGTELDLSWTETSSPVDHFTILRLSGGSYLPIAQVPGNQTMYANSGLTQNTTYSYDVVATNAGGDSASAGPASGTTPIAPTAPTNLMLTGATTTSITLSWTNTANNATGVEIMRQLESDNSQFVTILAPTATSFTDTGVLPGREYAYTVFARNAAGPSDGVVVVTETVPTAPTGLAVAPSGAGTVLTWTDSGHAVTSYNVYRSTTPGGEGAMPIGTAGGTRYVDSGLTPGDTYYYEITAADGGGTFQGSIVMGGGESVRSAEASAIAYLPGDTNGDGTVNFTDVLSLIQHYGSASATVAQGDFNGDGSVNFSDVLLLIQHYGSSLGSVASTAQVSSAASPSLQLTDVVDLLTGRKRGKSSQILKA